MDDEPLARPVEGALAGDGHLGGLFVEQLLDRQRLVGGRLRGRHLGRYVGRLRRIGGLDLGCRGAVVGHVGDGNVVDDFDFFDRFARVVVGLRVDLRRDVDSDLRLDLGRDLGGGVVVLAIVGGFGVQEGHDSKRLKTASPRK